MSELKIYQIKNYDYNDDPSLRNAAVLADLARMRELQILADRQKKAEEARRMRAQQVAYLQLLPQNVVIDDNNSKSIFYEEVSHENGNSNNILNGSIPNIDGIRLCDPT